MRTAKVCSEESSATDPIKACVRLFGGVIVGSEAVKLMNVFESPCTSTEGESEEEESYRKKACFRKRKNSSLLVMSSGTTFVSECCLPTDKGEFRLRAYRHSGEKNHEPVVMISGSIGSGVGIHVRVHDQCQTSEVLGSKRCDCREQLDLSLQHIQQHGGAVIYLQQEGRGIGFANKIAAYALQDNGLDTVDANRALGFADDERSYDCVPVILRDMGIHSIKLLTNNPFKIEALRSLGIKIIETIPIVVSSNQYNEQYLEAKEKRMGHMFTR